MFDSANMHICKEICEKRGGAMALIHGEEQKGRGSRVDSTQLSLNVTYSSFKIHTFIVPADALMTPDYN